MLPMTTGPAFRLARAAVFAAVCVVVTALGHALMSGAPLPWWAVGYAFAATSAAAWWLTGRERGALAVTGATVAAQAGLHELFGLAQRMSTRPAPASGSMFMGGGGMDHMNHPVPPAPAALPDEGVAHRVMSVFGHSDLGMFLAHLTAALLCALWLWRGEAAVFRAGRALAAAVFVPLRLVLTSAAVSLPPAPPHVGALAPVPRLRGVLLQHAVSRRGPPVLPASS
ncbi:Integral membrane protein OS=Streptomyces alboniger OX=132473 GN=CP975_32810 PE=4 SV=1 [Streptomyces alboniger]